MPSWKRSYDESRPVEQEKLDAVLEAVRLAPSACNGQPYHLTVCRGQAAQEVALACRGMGLNKFAVQAPVTEAVRLAPSACNGQPYHLTVCRGQAAQEVALACRGMGLNKFAVQAPVTVVLSEQPYVKSAAMGAKVKGNDYRSIDIGIAAAYLTAEATAQGLSSCILGWLDDSKIRTICGLDSPVRLVITLGYWATPKRATPSGRKSART